MYGCRSTCESTCVYIYVRVCVRVYMRTCRYMCACCVSCYSCDVAFPFVRCAGWHNIICIRPICEPLILNKWELLWTNLTFLLLFWSRLVTSCPTCSASKHTHTSKPSSSCGKDTRKTSCQTEDQHRDGQMNINHIKGFTTPFYFWQKEKFIVCRTDVVQLQ